MRKHMLLAEVGFAHQYHLMACCNWLFLFFFPKESANLETASCKSGESSRPMQLHFMKFFQRLFLTQWPSFAYSSKYVSNRSNISLSECLHAPCFRLLIDRVPVIFDPTKWEHLVVLSGVLVPVTCCEAEFLSLSSLEDSSSDLEEEEGSSSYVKASCVAMLFKEVSCWRLPISFWWMLTVRKLHSEIDYFFTGTFDTS